MDVLNTTASVISALATLGMLGIAWFALHTWRKELIGAKKIELAYQIMESVYAIQDALIYARLNMTNAGEIKEIENWMNSEKARDPEHTNIYPDRFQFLVPHRRLEDRQDSINEFKNLANKACLYWDKEIFKLFYELGDCTLQVRTAAKDLYYGDTNKNPSDLLKIIYSSPEDQMTKNINNIVEEFRINLEPIYKDKQTPWNKLNKVGGKG